MKGSIRIIAGFLIVFGAVGGIENGGSLLAGTALAIVGLALMHFGIEASKKQF